MVPYEDMSLEQIQELLDAQTKLGELPGVNYIQPEYIEHRNRRAAVCVYLDSHHRETINQLPATVGGLPVVVKLEDTRTSTVLETINLGTEGGA